jgi:hypothetical protein
MNRNATLVLIFFLLSSATASWYYLCKIKEVCIEQEAGQSILRSSIDEAIVFSWNEAEPMAGNGFERMHGQLIEELGPSGTLEIITYFDPREGDSSLAKARANNIMKLFPELDSSRFTSLVSTMELDSSATYFIASKLNIIFGHNHP